MITYADFMTVLFALSAALYSSSFYTESYMREVVAEINKIFTPDKPVEEPPVPPKQPQSLPRPSAPFIPDRPGHAPMIIPARPGSGVTDGGHESSFVRERKNLITIELDSNLLFRSGSADLSIAATPTLKRIADSLKETDYMIQVEGHTDDEPIKTRLFPSNWELSIYRSSRVVRELVRHGIPPEQLAAVGYGSTRPLAENGGEKIKNRRVVIIVDVEQEPPGGT